MKVPPKRKGNIRRSRKPRDRNVPSMKVPPKRKGNCQSPKRIGMNFEPLNESPSEKEGKWPPETSPQPCGRNGYRARTSRQAHTKSIPKPACTRPNIRDKPKHHASDTPYLRHVPGSRAQTTTPAGCFLSDPARVLTYERGWRGSGKPD